MTRKINSKTLFPVCAAIIALAGCAEEEMQAAGICVDVVGPEGVPVNAQVTVGGKVVAGGCRKRLDPNGTYTVQVTCPDGLVAPVLPAIDDLQPGETREITVTCTQDVRTITVSTAVVLTENQDGLITFNARSLPAAEIVFDGIREASRGEAILTYDASKSHTVAGRAFGALPAVVQEIAPGQYPDGASLLLLYRGEGVSGVCAKASNDELPLGGGEFKEIEEVWVEFNGSRREGRGEELCEYFHTEHPMNIVGEPIQGFAQPTRYFPPSTFRPGEIRDVDMRYLADGKVQYRCADTTRVLGEVFAVRTTGEVFSIGYPRADETLCTAVPINTDRFRFGEVDGVAHQAREVNAQERETYGYPTAVGHYDWDSTALLQVQALAGEENPVEVSETKVDGVVLKRGPYGQPSYIAVGLGMDHVVDCGRQVYGQYRALTSTITVTAVSLRPNLDGKTVKEVVCEYEWTGGGRGQSRHKTVEFQVRNEYGFDQPVTVSVNRRDSMGNMIDRNIYERTSQIAFTAEDGQLLEFEFQEEPYLVTPGDRTIVIADLAENDPAYEEDRSLWQYDIVYANAGPADWVCDRHLNHLGQEIPSSWIEFNGFESLYQQETGRRCRVLLVDQVNVLARGGRLGFTTQHELYIPARGQQGQGLQPNAIKLFTGVYVPNVSSAHPCLGTFGAPGEMFVNGNSAGWAAVTRGECSAFVPVDLLRENIVTFGTVPTATFPNPQGRRFAAGELGRGEQAMVIGYYEQQTANVVITNVTPQPFNASSQTLTIEYRIELDAEIDIKIFRVQGPTSIVVRNVLNATFRGRGTWRDVWDGRDASGVAVQPGQYSVLVQARDVRFGTLSSVTAPLAVTN